MKLGRVEQCDLGAREPSSFKRPSFDRCKIYRATAPTIISIQDWKRDAEGGKPLYQNSSWMLSLELQ
jgi:hypothetical protein